MQQTSNRKKNVHNAYPQNVPVISLRQLVDSRISKYFFIDTSLFQCSNGFYKMKNKGKEVDIERKYRLLFVGTLEQIKKVLLRFVDMCLQTSYS